MQLRMNAVKAICYVFIIRNLTISHSSALKRTLPLEQKMEECSWALGRQSSKYRMWFINPYQLIILLCRISTVLLECTPDGKDSVLYAPKESTMNEAHLTLFSKLSCSDQIVVIEKPGVAATFFLVLFIMFLCYLVVGMLYQYFFVGARGFEILPNYDFWCKVWISIKLGFLYLKNGCKVIPTEESYDAI